jgi:folate-binding protein YgfZ
MSDPLTYSHPARWYAELPQQGVLEVAGADAGCFLQGQATCDVLALAPGATTLGAFCTPQGRVFAVFRAVRSGDGYLLVMPQPLIAGVRERLNRFVLRAAVRIEDGSARWRCLGVLGATGQGPGWPAADRVESEAGTQYIFEIPPEGSGRRLLLLPAGDGAAWCQRLEGHGYTRVEAGHWQREEVLAGIPAVAPATAEEFIPQMLNLDRLGGIGFKKGCYTGQEIVARTQYLGSVKRRMVRLQLAVGSAAPEPGSRVDGPAGQQGAGAVVCGAAVAGLPTEVLAVLGTEAPSSLWIGGAEAVLFDLPQ